MKNIKFLSIIFILFAVSQISIAQSNGTENNGRDTNASPGPVAETPAAPKVDATLEVEDDKDIPGASTKEEPVDYYYPMDLDIINDDLSNSVHPAELVQRINDLTDMVEDMKRSYEELRLENKIVRESLTNCCSTSALGLTAKDAYLIQNAPNPFNESAEIRYFIPAGMENVEIHICDVKGEVLNKTRIKDAGYGTLEIQADQLSNGSYIYLLSIDGEVIDSKVMIKTANN